jgi:hypothetical protein
LKKKIIQLKKGQKTQVNLANLQNSRLGSWDYDNPIEKKLKNNYKTQSLINSMLNDEVEKKITKK